MKVQLAAPRGFCAGVERAIEIVERALTLYGPPVYVRKEIVHNLHVVEDLRRRGAIFVNDLSEVPAKSVTIFSAHGVSPAVRADADARELKVIDATCPLVTKVHLEALRYAEDGATILLIGHKGHEEVEGTMGEAPDRMRLVTSVEDAEALELPAGSKIGVLTQTTLSVDDTKAILEAIQRRFPDASTPRKDDICYATQNRQAAVKALAPESDLVLVIGAENSSNSQRLKEVALARGTPAHLVSDASRLDPAWFVGVRRVTVTAGASAPEHLVQELLEKLRLLGADAVSEFVHVEEHVRFPLPPEVI
jgi:4-hydroxy-3-methylbut-2-enyl diphosphate reductase